MENGVPKLSQTLEALLFVAGEGISIKKVAEITKSTPEEIEVSASELEHSLRERGIRLLRKDTYLSLVTAPETTAAVEELIKHELTGDLSRASLETLTIVAYKHPVSRPEIDYIRGVNSSFTLRNLIMRGLVEKVPHAKDGRTYLYQPSIDFMKFLGITSLDSLSEYTTYRSALDEGISQSENIAQE